MINPTNSRRDSFLPSIPTASIDSKEDNLTKRCKFNFSYIDFSQSAGQKFEEWTHDQLSKLMDKLCAYCKEPLKYWENKK